jgi:tRNA pseudouridine13 synthase
MHGSFMALPRAVFRAEPADFVVEEVPAYPPAGHGEHLFVTFRKVGLTTPMAVRALARRLGVEARDAGFAGWKDRHAVTTQTASFFVGGADAEAALAARAADLAREGVEVLSLARHPHKLRSGHLLSNRFTVRLRAVARDALPELGRAVEEVRTAGVPNAFGPQRFGADGGNVERALAFVGGKTPAPRDRTLARLLFSSLQSELFNRVLAERVRDGTWQTVLAGDLAKKRDTGGLFLVPEEPGPLADAAARAARAAIDATGPIFGARMRPASGAPGDLEASVLAAALGEDAAARLSAHRRLGEGTRRPLRLHVGELTWNAEETASRETVDLVVRFVLGGGGYATTVLARLVTLEPGAAAKRDSHP